MAGWVKREERRVRGRRGEERHRAQKHTQKYTIQRVSRAGGHHAAPKVAIPVNEWGGQKNYTGISITSLLDEEEEMRGEERRGEERRGEEREERRGEETMIQWGDRGLSGDHVSRPWQP
ncbi:hypothetical protein D4764_12G0007460 [Takifugu flavidus]|uniref:Uncharacterized protein n=1 Tax=Takifugu flavidus TaxID=433684 RepID=A0A5C6PDS3_9TELE|nr:hypothetical protein D4764_12G0007460 [Takifugu flavidus]